MITADLTATRVVLEDGSTAMAYPWRGGDVTVRDSAADGLRVILAFRDRTMDETAKALAIIPLIFLDPDAAWLACDYDPTAFGELIRGVCLDVYGLDVGGGHTEEPFWDPEEDAALIRTSLRQAYGIDWDRDRDRMAWGEFCALVQTLPMETPLGAMIHYRNPATKPKATRHNAAMREEWDRLHRLCALKDVRDGAGGVESQARAMDDMAAALSAAADRR